AASLEWVSNGTRCRLATLRRSVAVLKQTANDFLNIINTPAPGPAADTLQRRPQPRIGRQVRIRCQVRPRRSACQDSSALFGAIDHITFADQIDRPFESIAIDDDLDAVAVENFADRTAGQGLRADVADAGAGGDAAEAGVGNDRHVLTKA